MMFTMVAMMMMVQGENMFAPASVTFEQNNEMGNQCIMACSTLFTSGQARLPESSPTSHIAEVGRQCICKHNHLCQTDYRPL